MQHHHTHRIQTLHTDTFSSCIPQYTPPSYGDGQYVDLASYPGSSEEPGYEANVDLLAIILSWNINQLSNTVTT